MLSRHRPESAISGVLRRRRLSVHVPVRWWRWRRRRRWRPTRLTIEWISVQLRLIWPLLAEATHTHPSISRSLARVFLLLFFFSFVLHHHHHHRLCLRLRLCRVCLFVFVETLCQYIFLLFVVYCNTTNNSNNKNKKQQQQDRHPKTTLKNKQKNAQNKCSISPTN